MAVNVAAFHSSGKSHTEHIARAQRLTWLLNRYTDTPSNIFFLFSNIAPAKCFFVWTCQPNINYAYDVWLYLSAEGSPLPVQFLKISNACCRVFVFRVGNPMFYTELVWFTRVRFADDAMKEKEQVFNVSIINHF